MGKTARGLRSKIDDQHIEVSSGNVFADLGLPDAAELHTKVQLATKLQKALVTRGWTQAKAAEVLGISQPKVSALLKYRLEGFSVERLMILLTALGHDIDIVVKPPRRSRQPGRIVVAA